MVDQSEFYIASTMQNKKDSDQNIYYPQQTPNNQQNTQVNVYTLNFQQNLNNGINNTFEGQTLQQNGNKKKFSSSEIKLVQHLIERCLRLYMSQNEAITALHIYQNIEPSFISLVWQKLEEQNPDFFKAYNIRLKVKDQITNFNFLISQQAVLMQKKMNAQKYEQQQQVQVQQKEKEVYTSEEHFFNTFPDFLEGDLNTDFLNTEHIQKQPLSLDTQHSYLVQQHQPQQKPQQQQNVKIHQQQPQQHHYHQPVQNMVHKEDNSILNDQSNPPTSGLFDLSENPLGLEDDIDSSYILPFGV